MFLPNLFGVTQNWGRIRHWKLTHGEFMPYQPLSVNSSWVLPASKIIFNTYNVTFLLPKINSNIIAVGHQH